MITALSSLLCVDGNAHPKLSQNGSQRLLKTEPPSGIVFDDGVHAIEHTGVNACVLGSEVALD
jgi:hypothetical protein